MAWKRRYSVVVVALVAVAAVIAVLIGQRRSASPHASHGKTGSGDAGRVVRRAGPPTSTIGGTVRTKQGTPIAKATVCAATQHREPRCALTDASGGYTIDKLFAVGYEVTAAAATYRPGRFHPDGARHRDRFILGPGERRSGVDITLDGPAAQLTGTVLDISGGPIAHARVRVAREDWSINDPMHWYPATETAADGTFTLWVSPGEVWIDASADGYASVQQQGVAPGRVELLLTPGGSIAGTVVDGAGAPVPDALVGADWIDEHPRTRSDADGRFVIEGLEPARYVVSARTPNGYGQAASSVMVRLAAHVEGIVIRIDPAARVTGRVVVAPPATPCPSGDVRVVLHDPFGDDVEMTPSDDGTLFADGVIAATYYARVKCHGYFAPLRYPPVVVADRDLDVTWPVTAGGTLRGSVRTSDGTPVAAGRISAQSGDRYVSGRTAIEGTYELAGLAPGEYGVTASLRRATSANAQLAIGAGVIQHDFTLDLPAQIAGIVVDETNRPVGDVEVRATTGGKPGALSNARTDGQFTLTVTPGTFEVQAARDWQHPIGKPEQVTVTAANPGFVRLVVPPQTGTIEGDIVDAEGRPVADALVSAFVPSPLGLGEFHIGWDDHPTFSGPDGKFTITRLGPGSYTVVAERRGGGQTRAKGVAPGAKLHLVIGKTASLAGRVAHADGSYPAQMRLTVRNADNTAEQFYRLETLYHTQGQFQLDELPGGALTIAVVTNDGFAVTTIELAPGEQRAGVAITLERNVTIRGRIVDAFTRSGLPGYFILPRTKRARLGATADYDDITHQSDADGRFAVVAPPGPLDLQISKHDFRDNNWCSPPQKLDVAKDIDLGDVLVVTPRAKPGGQLGFTLSTGTVDSLDVKGPAAAAGLRLGDVVTAIDGIGPGTKLVEDCAYALLAIAPGTAVSLTLARGDTIKVTAK